MAARTANGSASQAVKLPPSAVSLAVVYAPTAKNAT